MAINTTSSISPNRIIYIYICTIETGYATRKSTMPLIKKIYIYIYISVNCSIYTITVLN